MDIKEYFNNLTQEQINKLNQKQFKHNKRIHEDFKTAYKKGKCSLCDNTLDFFDKDKPCFHWFLRIANIKKKHFKKYLSKAIGFLRLDSYFRWMANLEEPFKNINDLKSEMSDTKIVEYTIRYTNIEWSVSISKNDIKGHRNSIYAKFPHFHLQMKVNNEIFIRFKDFHIPLSDEDIFHFKVLKEIPDKIGWNYTFGAGMSIMENQENFELIDKAMKVSKDEETATFNTNTLLKMPKGKKLSGEVVHKILEESKQTGIPVRHLINKYCPDASVFTEIQPGKGVPKLSKRTKIRGKEQNKKDEINT